MSKVILHDTFVVNAVDPEGKVFDRVSRVVATSEGYAMDLTLDINCELFPLNPRDKVLTMFALGLDLSGDAVGVATYGQNLADKYEYIMHGKVYKMDEHQSGKMTILVSFGGLLMKLESKAAQWTNVFHGTDLYLLMKKI